MIQSSFHTKSTTSTVEVFLHDLPNNPSLSATVMDKDHRLLFSVVVIRQAFQHRSSDETGRSAHWATAHRRAYCHPPDDQKYSQHWYSRPDNPKGRKRTS